MASGYKKIAEEHENAMDGMQSLTASTSDFTATKHNLPMNLCCP